MSLRVVKLIGLCGLMGSGKTTAAEELRNAAYAPCAIRPLAGPIKSMLRSLGLSDAQVRGRLKGEPCELLGGKTPRHAMQTLGTQWGRECIDHEIWLRAWRAKWTPEGCCTIVDDVRFGNEADMIRELGGVVLRIDRPITRSLKGLQHASESLDFEADAVIKNTGTRADLGWAIDQALVDLGVEWAPTE
ncbi:MAG: deoxynucleotide monophosphate kinase [Planctomycetota bacterium]|nr:deoxynucleotide monophosphate kinase [Planctomycetota bacterium]